MLYTPGVGGAEKVKTAAATPVAGGELRPLRYFHSPYADAVPLAGYIPTQSREPAGPFAIVTVTWPPGITIN